MCHLVVGWGWAELILMGCWAQNSKPGFWGLPDGWWCTSLDLLWKPSVCCESLLFNKITTADTLLSNKMITAESKRKHRKTAWISFLINWKGYERFDERRGRIIPWRHVTWNGIGWMLFGVVQRVFLVCILIFFFFFVDLGFWLFAGG